MKKIELNEDPNDSWARVELYRWLYGELPTENSKPLNESLALEKMALAIENGNPKNFPTPFNVVSVLRYISKFLKFKETRNIVNCPDCGATLKIDGDSLMFIKHNI